MKFVHPVREVLTKLNDNDRDLQKIVDAILYKYNDDVFNRVIYTESHDEVANGKARVPEEIQPGDAESAFAKKRAILGLVLVMTSPGIPMIFQGQEFLEDGYFKDTEELNWDKLNQLEGIDHLSADLIKLRTGETEGAGGLQGQQTEIIHFNQENKILAYGIGVEEDRNWKIKFNSSWKGYDQDFSDLPVEDIEKIHEHGQVK